MGKGKTRKNVAQIFGGECQDVWELDFDMEDSDPYFDDFLFKFERVALASLHARGDLKMKG